MFKWMLLYSINHSFAQHLFENNYPVGGVGGLCEGGRGGGTGVNPYISLHIPLGPIVYTDHIHTEDSKLPHSKYI